MSYVLDIPFWIDTDGYSDRDRLMFVAGFEFAKIVRVLEREEPYDGPIHRENESRIRLLCSKFGRTCQIEPHFGYRGCETWSQLVVGEKP